MGTAARRPGAHRPVDPGPDVYGKRAPASTGTSGPTHPTSDGGVDDAYVDEQEDESFPASDPHADWAGAPSWL
jgi:hypothetical protein